MNINYYYHLLLFCPVNITSLLISMFSLKDEVLLVKVGKRPVF